MDFGTLLHMAKKNNDSLRKESSSYYSTKYAPPKKESKEKKLSDNIQKFLQKREQEERERKRQEKEKLNKLLAMRDEKSKNKIKKMLKVTKSANKSVLDDCHNSNQTAITLQGPDQPDQDDYGYVSMEANAFYQKYIEKVKNVKEDKGFAPSRPISVSDLKGTKERVKAAITREIEEKKSGKQRSSHSASENGSIKISSGNAAGTGSSSGGSGSMRAYSSTKCLYDPVAEKQEEERKKRDEEQKRAKQRKPPPPIMDFQALLKLAEKKQHEPIELPTEVKKPKNPERLLTSKEKRELEERKRAKEARERREREQRPGDSSSKERERERKDNAPVVARIEPNGRIPKLSQPIKATNVNQPSNSSKNLGSSTASKSVISTKTTTQVASDKSSKKLGLTETHSSAFSAGGKPNPLPTRPSTSAHCAPNSKKPTANGSSSAVSTKKHYEGPTREFPPRDIKSIKSRSFPPADIRRSDTHQNYKTQAQKRRILDDDDEDYDSEMDDFIDDGEEEADYSSHIKAIFGYDKSKYRDRDDVDDRAMESNFAQVQREEYISKKIGLQEDLEDMRLEALEKKRKLSKKKKMH